MKNNRLKEAGRLVRVAFQSGAMYVPFAVGGPALAFVGAPFFRILGRLFPSTLPWKQDVAQKFFQVITALLETSGAIRVDFRIHGDLDLEKPAVYAANHPSLLDVILLMGLVPRATCLLKSTDRTSRRGNSGSARMMPALWCLFLDTAVRDMGYIPMPGHHDDKRRLLDVVKTCVDKLGSGRPLVIFPEGTRSKTDGMVPFNDLAFKAAIEAGVPLVPVAIRVSESILPKGVFHIDRETPVRFEVNLLDAIHPEKTMKAKDMAYLCRRVIQK
ncbi:MAG: 1-acyl-sn-glycerol-3-phosphate acyltransferase, partial [Deltaproteobacteria bacterium]|nr:1-acyl-sn-glycerol-3-phosphate acyltransferase [Deltaproteobacteria bacterium]